MNNYIKINGNLNENELKIFCEALEESSEFEWSIDEIGEADAVLKNTGKEIDGKIEIIAATMSETGLKPYAVRFDKNGKIKIFAE